EQEVLQGGQASGATATGCKAEAAARSVIGAAVVDETARLFSELERMPPPNVGDAVKELESPVRPLDLGERAAATRGGKARDDDRRESTAGRQAQTSDRGAVGIHVVEVAVIRLANLVAVTGVAELVLAVESE